jgi:hypothetical protein
MRLMALFLERLAGRRRLFMVYVWGKPLAPSEREGNSGRGAKLPRNLTIYPQGEILVI